MLLNGLIARTEHASFYRRLQASVGSHRLWTWFVEAKVLPLRPKRILDLGCGTSDILTHLPDEIEYVGIDPHEPYIKAASARYNNRGQWHMAEVNHTTLKALGSFDMVLLLGVLHHCSDEMALELLNMAKSTLTDTGCVLHLDGCIHPEAGWLETMLYRLERGLYVRTQAGYGDLMTQSFATSSQHVEDGLLRLPYRYCVGLGRTR